VRVNVAKEVAIFSDFGLISDILFKQTPNYLTTNTKPHLFKKWGLDNQFMATSWAAGFILLF
jgi:hypothetical protein